MGHGGSIGGGIIKRLIAGAMLFALAIVVCIIPLLRGEQTKI
jgi:hypothetical protein